MADYWLPQASVADSYWNFQENQRCFRTSTFRDLISAFPRPKHTSRVTKPRSAGNSPSSAVRRTKTMSYHPPMYQQPPQQRYNAPVDAAAMASAIHRARQPRPMSWHPASVGMAAYPAPQYMPAVTTSENPVAAELCASPSETIPVAFGSDGILPSYPIADSAISDTMLPFSLSGVGDTTAAMQHPYLQQQMNDSQVGPFTWDAGTSDFSAMMPPMTDGWSFDMMSMNNNGMPSVLNDESAPSSTGPSTPSFLPIQQFDDDSIESGQEKPEDELVGMGLYNHPEMSPNGLLSGFGGKGLKLEETFTPSPNDERDAEEDNDDQQESKAEPVKSDVFDYYQAQPEPRIYQQSEKPAQNMLNKSFFFDDDDSLDQDGGISQQFFNPENQPCMNYAYGWI